MWITITAVNVNENKLCEFYTISPTIVLVAWIEYQITWYVVCLRKSVNRNNIDSQLT